MPTTAFPAGQLDRVSMEISTGRMNYGVKVVNSGSHGYQARVLSLPHSRSLVCFKSKFYSSPIMANLKQYFLAILASK